MTMRTYECRFEIAGPTAMWTRPDTGDAPVSYPAPTLSAAKGMFESILWLQNAEVIPTKVEICSPLVYHTYTTNYGGPLRKGKVMKTGSSYQLLATVLINVCYRLHAEIKTDTPADHLLSDAARSRIAATKNGAHTYQDIFNRRLANGQWHAVPCLGWKEFVPEYLGAFRAGTSVCEEIGMVLPSMLATVFSSGKYSKWSPVFRQNVRIDKGVLDYAQ